MKIQSINSYRYLNNKGSINFASRNINGDNYSDNTPNEEHAKSPSTIGCFFDKLFNPHPKIDKKEEQKKAQEIKNLQQETMNWDETHKDTAHPNTEKAKSVGNSLQGKSIARNVPAIQPSRESRQEAVKIENAEPIRTIKMPAQVQNKSIFPRPTFSFNYTRLMQDLAQIDNVDSSWVNNNPESTLNILNAASRGEGISKQTSNQYFLSPGSKANAVNMLLKNKEEFIKEAQKQHAQEKQAYVDSIMGYTNHTDKELVKKSLDAIEKYGTWEDIDKIGFVRMTDDESLIVPLVRAVAKVGRVREDDYFFIQYITAREHNLSNQTYAIVLEAISKLSNNVGKEYEDMVRLVNKIPADTDGKFTTTLISTLTKLGKEEDIEYLNKYLRNYNRVNDFINKGQKTPESVKDAVAKIVEGIKRKTKQ